MKIRIGGRPEATFTVRGTISRPQLLATDHDSKNTIRASAFEAEILTCPVDDAPGTVRWEVHTLTIRGRRIVGRRTTEAWASRSFYHPLEFPEGVPDWVRTLAANVLPAQPPPDITRRTFSIPDRPHEQP
ncbi:hypothetical protein [Streptomyces sp. NPDC048272]|uniref:hypothetical protein n=1 Tax=Streptomyces sp. NPDC048272 TaxID=3154616 RepID=UPI003438A9C5